MPPRKEAFKPFWATGNGETVRLYLGDTLRVLRQLPSQSVQCIVTSPPYWGLRDYGTGTWEGGSEDCRHQQENRGTVQYLDRHGKEGKNDTTWQGAERHSTVKPGVTCKHCGAVRVEDHQLGSEQRPDCLGWARGENCAEGSGWATGCHVCRMVLVFREVRRVLRDDGVAWVNYGDSYASGEVGRKDKKEGKRFGPEGVSDSRKGIGVRDTSGPRSSLPSGNLCGVPWRVALALQADGWVLRQDIIWHKPSPMPESVTNRCTKAHEYVFLLTKSQRYYCDMEAIKEKVKQDWGTRDRTNGKYHNEGSGLTPHSGLESSQTTSNKRSVWTIASQGYPGAHFATFPPKLVEPMILAGTSAKGACLKCGAPWVRVTAKVALKRERPNEYVKRTGEAGTGNSCANSVAGVDVETLGWEPGCRCGVGVRPCIVLDPFIGSGTTCAVSASLRRWSWGIDLSRTYLVENAIPRVREMLLSCRWAWDDVPDNHHADPKLIGSPPPFVKVFNV